MDSSTNTITKPVILVVDDNQDAAVTLGMLLKLKGYQTHTCFSGEEALRAVSEFRPDAVLLDLAMPGMDGYETARQLRKGPDHVPMLIALSGYSQEEDRRKAMEAGFDEHLVKPADMNLLAQLLARFTPHE